MLYKKQHYRTSANFNPPANPNKIPPFSENLQKNASEINFTSDALTNANIKVTEQQKQMASGGLGAIFQEKAQLFGNKGNNDKNEEKTKPGMLTRARDAFRRLTGKKATSTSTQIAQ